MQTTVLEQPALRLISAKAAKFPEGTKDAFAAIESRLSTLRSRRMYGLVFSTQDGLEYYAGLVPESEREEQQFGFPIIEISSGLCVRTKLLNWAEHTDQIGPLVSQMIAEFGIDPSRPTMEYYRSQRELHLLVPILDAPMTTTETPNPAAHRTRASAADLQGSSPAPVASTLGVVKWRRDQGVL